MRLLVHGEAQGIVRPGCQRHRTGGSRPPTRDLLRSAPAPAPLTAVGAPGAAAGHGMSRRQGAHPGRDQRARAHEYPGARKPDRELRLLQSERRTAPERLIRQGACPHRVPLCGSGPTASRESPRMLSLGAGGVLAADGAHFFGEQWQGAVLLRCLQGTRPQRRLHHGLAPRPHRLEHRAAGHPRREHRRGGTAH